MTFANIGKHMKDAPGPNNASNPNESPLELGLKIPKEILDFILSLLIHRIPEKTPENLEVLSMINKSWNILIQTISTQLLQRYFASFINIKNIKPLAFFNKLYNVYQTFFNIPMKYTLLSLEGKEIGPLEIFEAVGKLMIVHKMHKVQLSVPKFKNQLCAIALSNNQQLALQAKITEIQNIEEIYAKAISCAIKTGQLQKLKTLVEKLAEKKITLEQLNLDSAELFNDAAMGNHPDIVNYLFSTISNLECYEQCYALPGLAKYGHLKEVSQLYETLFDTIEGIPLDKLQLAIEYASKNEDKPMISLLNKMKNKIIESESADTSPQDQDIEIIDARAYHKQHKIESKKNKSKNNCRIM